ncbi:hypothetical protein LTR36_001169 [Oleoguttula mirabilis]|uniref:Protein kinase domain-containing protein n=1 Tax=Oleoguttula mirabilis TaxID=1507867 RepID=A0AAV9J2Y5_9PEZI|nr:hypothetical protein LTR36_001169 [Oleoguttula mirabilis]
MAAVAHPHRPQIRRNSPLSIHHHNTHNTGFSANAPAMKRFGVDDSDSDDEPPPAIKFSKVTQALLADAPLPSSPPRQERVSEAPRFNRSASANKAGLDTPSRAPGIKIVRKSSPSVLGHDRGYTPPRIVQVGGRGSGSGARSISISGPYPQRFAVNRDPTPDLGGKPELVTPAPAPRALRVSRTRAGSNASQDGQQHPPPSLSRPGSRNGAGSAAESHEHDRSGSELSRSASHHHPPETVSRYGSSTMGRSRNTSAEAVPPPGSQRIKRAPIGTGSFLKSGPVRRGLRRRDSEDNVSPADEVPSAPASQPSATAHTPQDRSFSGAEGQRSRNGSVDTRATTVDPVSVHDFAHKSHASHASHESRNANSYFSRSQASNDSRPDSRQTSNDLPRSRQPSAERYQQRKRPSITTADEPAPAQQVSQHRQSSVDRDVPKPALDPKPPQRVPSMGRAQYRYVAPKIHTDASEDQENMPPPTFKRNKDQDFKYFGKQSISILSDDERPKPRMIDETPVPVPAQQQERRALGAISGNTPHRPAPPPPPKMSVLNTATATAGASVTKSKKKRSHIVINGKIFTQMGKIGKGGSSDVYCVMAENFKTFALKRVKLEDCDESAVRGYKGEIDLLKKLTEVERVVRLFDWELNDDKQELCVLMEKGDTDLNRILTLRLNGIDAKFDSVFARYQWKEMLECVQAVHDYDIVHSDLKPANFLVVQGRLKLIDFGIANAIDTDNTCNVHRDSHVGTPNYMSPESITDTNAPQPGMARDDAGRPLKKDMRIGKASDVWSLGCILYQMTYGRPPFAHISNQIVRIMAITNPKHAIEFPDRGVGGTLIPPALKATLRKCLNRDPERRPTIAQLLSEEDAFMNPEGQGGVVITEVLLSQIIHKVVERCKDPKRGIPSPEEVGQYPRNFMVKIREMQEAG